MIEEYVEDIGAHLNDFDLMFVVAGFGGGTGNGAIRKLSEIAKGFKVPSVAVIVIPVEIGDFRREKALAQLDDMIQLEEGRLADHVIIVDAAERVDEDAEVFKAFRDVDEYLTEVIRSIVDLACKGPIESVLSDGMYYAAFSKNLEPFSAADEALGGRGIMAPSDGKVVLSVDSRLTETEQESLYEAVCMKAGSPPDLFRREGDGYRMLALIPTVSRF